MNPGSPAEPYAIVFAGGGALAAWQVGCAEAILEANGGPPAVLAGSSAGAINAAAMRAGMGLAEVGELWGGLSRAAVCRLSGRHIVRSSLAGLAQAVRCVSFKRGAAAAAALVPSIFDTRPLEQTLRDRFCDRVDEFFRSDIAFGVTAADLRTRERVYFYDRMEPQAVARGGPVEWRRLTGGDDLIRALLASSALPVLFPPVDGLYDGGIYRNSPLGLARRLGARRIYALIPSPAARAAPTGVLQTAGQLVDAWVSQPLEWEMTLIEVQDRALRSRTRIIPIRPRVDLRAEHDIGTLSFGRHVSALIDRGRRDAREQLDQTT